MTNVEIAAAFRRLADLMDLRGDNGFKIRAYRNAADVIEDHPTPLVELHSAGGSNESQAALQTLPGIGAAISQKIADLLATGTFKAYEEIQKEIPLSSLDLLRVESVGMKTAQTLYRQFQLTNLEDFAKFIAGGGLDCAFPTSANVRKKRCGLRLRLCWRSEPLCQLRMPRPVFTFEPLA
jgi:DNA polymerase (family X)